MASILFLQVPAYSCSLFYPTVQVGRNFRVRVMDRGQPVQGLPVALDPQFAYEHYEGGHTVTDAQGSAHFAEVPAGSFFIHAERDGGIADGAIVEVETDGPVNAIVPLKWPSSPLSLRSVSGHLRAGGYDPKHTKLSLTLLEGLSGQVMEATRTDENGEFAFADVASGIYFLQLNPSGLKGPSGEELKGLITLAISRDAQWDGLDLDLGWSSCGLMYVNQAGCKQNEVEVSKLCGDALDVNGAVISRAEILLQDNDGKTLDRTHSDAAGHFLLPAEKAGNYKLVVQSPGFSPVRTTVHILSTAGSESCSRPIKVQMGAFGSCSSINTGR